MGDYTGSSTAQEDSGKATLSPPTHLCFADDLLIFMDGSLSSVQGIIQVLHNFEAFSGLAISVDKSSVFPSGLSEEETTTITAATGFPVGSLLVRYLGLPLNSRKLSMSNCEPMLKNVSKLLTKCATLFSGRVP